MSQVPIQKSKNGEKGLPVFDEIAKCFEAVRKRAFDLFEQRGRQFGHELEDWLRAERELLGSQAAELVDKDGVYEMQIALPGFGVKEVEVAATANTIIVHAAREEEKKTEKGNVLWTEFGSNNVYRRFEVPNPIDVDKVSATLQDGLLKINAPKTAKPKEIAITAT